MKKLLTLILLSISQMCWAKEDVVMVYPFSLGDSIAAVIKSSLDTANQNQDQYRFLMESRPGAGGAIAANHVAKKPNTLLANAAGVWLRPRFYPNESHDPQSLRTIMIQFECPFAVTSARFSDWSQVPKQQSLTIGTSGLGVVSHLTALQVQKTYDQLRIIPFKSTSDALQNAAGKHVDFHVGFVRQAEEFQNKGITILGITGNRSVGNYKTLASQGFSPDLKEITLNHFVLVSKNTDPKKAADWQKILRAAMKSQRTRDLLAMDYCVGREDTDVTNTDETQAAFWNRITQGVTIK